MMDGRPFQQFLFIFCSLGLLILPQSSAQNMSSTLMPTTDDDDGPCEFDGTVYDDNEIIPNLCTTMTCENGRWSNNGYFNNSCAQCRLSDDPHITTFDDVYYHFHGICNYSLTQHEFSFNASFGIYGKFSPCADVWNWNQGNQRHRRHLVSSPSCSDVTTFTDNRHTVIVMTKFENARIWVNDEEVPLTFSPQVVVTLSGPHPVFAWTDGSCVTIVGSQGLTLKKCGWIIYIWAFPDLQETINGLCGHYDGFAVDDFTGRSGNVYPFESYPFEFPVSWTTEDQDHPECFNLTRPSDGSSPTLSRRKRQIPVGPGENPCTIPTEDIEDQCNEAFGDLANGNPAINAIVANQIMSCIADICMMEMIGVVPEEIDEWFDAMNDMVMTSISIAERTTPDGQPIPETEEHSHGNVIIDVLQEVILH